MRVYSSEQPPYFTEYRETFDLGYEHYDDYFDDSDYDSNPTDYPAYCGEQGYGPLNTADTIKTDPVEIERRFLNYEAGLQNPETI